LRVLESAARGINSLDAVAQRLDSTTVGALLCKLQAPPLNQIADLKGRRASSHLFRRG